MGTRTSYPPGIFCWADLATTEPAAAQRFYQDLFGWSFSEAEPDRGYAIARAGDDAVAGLFPLEPEQRERQVVPFWASYVAVADAETTAIRATELGGGILREPFDVTGLGRFAILRDPSGALLGVWGPRELPGAQRVNDPGCLAWNELSTDDPAQAEAFYSKLFGWRFEASPDSPDPYWTIRQEGAARQMNGGIRELRGEERAANVSAYWLPYFTVESVHRAVEQTELGGGTRHAGPIQLPFGQVAVLGDPHGAVFAGFDGEYDA